uniref:Uncharacterized protein MANES_09G025300 n=1 Tax=Rhizophora mucronata TaxID=61149 RepID=A0A2P2KHF0_RHIMU
MGEAPAFVVDDLHDGVQNGLSSKSQGCEAAITVGDKTVLTFIFSFLLC